MSIEPIGSAMTFQAQNNTPKVKTEKVQAEPQNRDVSYSGTENPDQTTVTVVAAQESDAKGQDGGKGGDQAAQKQEAIKEMLSDMTKDIGDNEQVEFGIHEETNRIMIKIVDKDTKDVIKEFPPEKTLDMIAKVCELAGIFVDEKR